MIPLKDDNAATISSYCYRVVDSDQLDGMCSRTISRRQGVWREDKMYNGRYHL